MEKINLTISDEASKKMIAALVVSGDLETGGVLIGNKITGNHFQIIDISVSETNTHSTFASFIRETKESKLLLQKHFNSATGYYLGEWHSHPNFSLHPSHQDVRTMKKILKDPSYGVSFAFLLIAQLLNGKLNAKAFCFHQELKGYITLQ